MRYEDILSLMMTILLPPAVYVFFVTFGKSKSFVKAYWKDIVFYSIVVLLYSYGAIWTTTYLQNKEIIGEDKYTVSMIIIFIFSPLTLALSNKYFLRKET